MKFNARQKAAVIAAGETMGKSAFAEKCRVNIGFCGQVARGEKSGCAWDTYERVYGCLCIYGGLLDTDTESWPLSKQGKPRPDTPTVAEDTHTPAEIQQLARQWHQIIPVHQEMILACIKVAVATATPAPGIPAGVNRR